MAENYDRGFDALFQGYYGQEEEINLIELARRILSMPLNADRVRAGTIESKLVKILADFDGPASITLDALGFRANDGERDTVYIGTNGKAAFKQIDITNDMSTFSSIRMDTTGLRATDGITTTFEIDTQGKAYFRGDITSGARITGAMIRTGEFGTKRIEISGNSFKGVNADNSLQGLVFDMNGSNGISDIGLYRNGQKMLEFYDDITGYTITEGDGAWGMGLGSNWSNITSRGYWNFTGTVDFSNATVLGLGDGSVGG